MWRRILKTFWIVETKQGLHIGQYAVFNCKGQLTEDRHSIVDSDRIIYANLVDEPSAMPSKLRHIPTRLAWTFTNSTLLYGA